LFAEATCDALQLNHSEEDISLPRYKKAFTADAVRKIYEAIMEIWPPNTDIQSVLERTRTDVSGLYIGDYDPEYVKRALVRHSIYANKILLIDPFQHPHILNDKYNPLLDADHYRAQTLKNVNFYLGCMPWVESGLVEFIRTPGDFDRKLNFEAMRRGELLRDAPKLQEAFNDSQRDLAARHRLKQAHLMTMLSASDGGLRRMFREIKSESKTELSEDDFIVYIQRQRDRDPDFLEPLGPDNRAQLHMMSTGGPYDVARLAAQMTGSYLFTDLHARWAMIEHDRPATAENNVWSPFAKALQNTTLRYLNNLSLDHALKLRGEGRLEGLRSFLTGVWDKARGDQPFSEDGSIHLANSLADAINSADAEWALIKKDLAKVIGTSAAASVTAAGPAILSGNALFMGAATAAAVIGAASVATWSRYQRSAYLKKHPAAFFMDLRDE
jgi:hypothetical protein